MNAGDETKGVNPDGKRAAIDTVLRSLVVGVGGGSVATVAAFLVDPTGPSAKLAGMLGVTLGGLNGLLEILVKHRRSFLMGRAEARKAMIDAEAGADRQARIEAERKLAWCEEQKGEFARQIDELRATARDLAATVERVRKDHQTERMIDKHRIDKLTDDLAHLSNVMNQYEKSRRDKDTHP